MFFFKKYTISSIKSFRKTFMEALKPSKKWQIREKIELTPNEKDLFALFTNFVQDEKLNCVLRVAGGWVRDKLLGKECKDIDIAIDNMTGEEFIKKAKEYFTKNKMEDVHGFGVTKLNPDKSKHLETATIKIRDLWIDFVNLRGETYDPLTRVPTMRHGTAEEDAFRRDLTINALFYNLITNEVEDYTKKGLEDLKNGVIRTPLKPYSTFFDDPLRILRTFRFASRFGFQVEPEIIESLKSIEILNALRNKVSRERVGIELNLILNNESVFDCLTYYYQNNLWDIVFEVKSIMKDFDQSFIDKKSKSGYLLCKIVYENLQILENYKILQKHFNEKSIRFYAYLTAAVLPYSEFKFEKNKQTPSLISYIIKDSIKFPNKESNMVQNLDNSIIMIKDILKSPDSHDYKSKIIKWIKQNGDSWELAFFLALMQEKLFSNEEFVKKEKNFNELYDFIIKGKLSLIYEIKPLLDGGEIIKIFEVKPGPTIKLIQDNIFIWQVENQEKTKNELLDFIKSQKEFFLIRHD